jgi:hypothetical protein
LTRHAPNSLKVSCALALTVLALSGDAEAIRVRVAAGSRLDGRVDRAIVGERASGVVVRGTLRDDVGAPVPNSHVSITFFGEANEGAGAAAANRPLPLSQTPLSCAASTGAGDREPHVAPDEYVVDTDQQGEFCVQTMLPIDQGTMKLSFAGTLHHDATAAEIRFDIAHTAIALVFDPDPSIASLDHPIFSVGLRVTASRISKDGWRVVLRDEKGRALGDAPVDPDGLVRIDVPTEKLGDPGPGVLTASLEGTTLAARPISHAIERHARVDLALSGTSLRGVPEDGIDIAVLARSSRGPVAAGAVEVVLGDHPVGAAPIRGGHAALVATFASTRERPAASIRYLADAPWWEPGPALRITMEVQPPGVLRRAPPILLALAIAAWMMRRTWLPRVTRARQKEKERLVPGVAPDVLAVVRPHRPGEGWSGTVIDAHDGHAVAGAVVAIVIPSFPSPSGASAEAARGGSGVIAEVVTDARGQFSMAKDAPRGTALLRVQARWHATFEQPLPPPSEVSVPLVARRRRILDRFVAWASQEWGPWHGTREPTPQQVAARARVSSEQMSPEHAREVQAWARAVEWTAFGGGGVDEGVEQSVSSLEPTRRRKP